MEHQDVLSRLSFPMGLAEASIHAEIQGCCKDPRACSFCDHSFTPVLQVYVS